MTVTVYGSSDDLIEIEGDVREEFTPHDGEAAILGFSDGTLLEIVYNEIGVWKITTIQIGAGVALTCVNAEGPDSDNYSDRVTLDSQITWVVVGTEYATQK